MMFGRIVVLGSVSLLSLSTAQRPATAQEPSLDSLRSQIDSIVAPYLAAADFMGVVGVHRDGEAPLIRPYGLASVELDVPHEPEGIFMIGSVSKQFTAVAILLLEQDALLRTTDPVSRHVSEFAHGESITIEQLLAHTSGVADVFALKRLGQSAGQVGTFEETITDLSRQELTHPPGSAYRYSNGGYAVLAAIIERVSGVTFGEYLDKRLFQPLDMLSTSHDGPGPATRHRVNGYDPWGRHELTHGEPIGPAFSTGSGSIWSSAGDLLAWNSALHGGRVLSDSAYEKLTRDYGHGYGYGVSVFRRFGHRVVGHDGRIGGFASDVAHYPDDGVTIVVLSNVQSVSRDEIRRLVAAAVLREPYTVPRPRKFLDRTNAPLRDFTGAYSFGPGFTVTISALQGRLLAKANQGADSELVPVGRDEWFSRTLYAEVRFARDQAGHVDRLIWGRGDGAPVGHRVGQ